MLLAWHLQIFHFIRHHRRTNQMTNTHGDYCDTDRKIPEDTYVETVGLEWMRWRVVNKRWIWIPEVLLLKWRKPKLETNSEEIRRGSDSPFFLCATESSLLRLCTIEMSWLFALFNGNVLRWQRHPLPAWLKETDAKTIAILIYFSPNHETEAAASPA